MQIGNNKSAAHAWIVAGFGVFLPRGFFSSSVHNSQFMFFRWVLSIMPKEKIFTGKKRKQDLTNPPLMNGDRKQAAYDGGIKKTLKAEKERWPYAVFRGWMRYEDRM